MTEQTLSVLVTFISDSVDLEADYNLGGGQPGVNSLSREIVPSEQSEDTPFFIFSDQFPEGTETFRMILSTRVNTTNIDPPTTTFTSATIFILDNDCEWLS